ncbi:MAG: recombinase family protein [Pseudomonadota bacterium]|nr:recombinase family protein [Pseudomonadota bacterium]
MVSEPPPPIRTALYIRSATEPGGSLNTQEARLRASVADRPAPHVIVRTFRDPATSGLTLDQPGLRDLLAVAAAHAIDVVMVTGLDRLTRSPRDRADLRHDLAAHGVRITTPDEERDPAFATLIQQFSALAAS